MIVKKLTTLILCASLIKVLSGASISNVFVESETSPVRYYPYSEPYTSVASPQYSQINTLPGSVSAYADPCVTPCVIPGQTLAAVKPSANVITYSSPYATIPVVVGPANEEPKNGYQYSYVVYDENTGDHKIQRELSDGSVVRGEYSFIQPDGFVRKVQYVADDLKGFNAIVKNYLPVTLDDTRKEIEIKHKNEHCPPYHGVKKESLKEPSAEELEESSKKHASDAGQNRQKSSKHGYGHRHEDEYISENDHESEHNHERGRKSKQSHAPEIEHGHSHETGYDRKSKNSHESSHSHESEHSHEPEDGHKSEKSHKSGPSQESEHNHGPEHEAVYSHSSDHKSEYVYEHDQSPILGHGHSHEFEHSHEGINEHSHEELLKNSHGHSHKQGQQHNSNESGDVLDKRNSHEHKYNQEHNHELQHISGKSHRAELGHSQERVIESKEKLKKASSESNEHSEEKNAKEIDKKKSNKHFKTESEEVSQEKSVKKEHIKNISEESHDKHIEKGKKKSKEQSIEISEDSIEHSAEKHKKIENKESGEESSEESKEELKEKYHTKPKKESGDSHEKHKMKSKKGSKAKSSESESVEDSNETTSVHVKHKEAHGLVMPEQKVFVPYHDVVRCLQAALRKSNGKPAALREEPSPLTYLVLNKPC